MIYDIIEVLKKFFRSRILVLGTVFALMLLTIVWRVFSLQVINGSDYRDSFEDQITKNINIEASRGNIYDCKGRLLAYNELAYSVTITDSGTYSGTTDKNEQLNAILAEVLDVLHANNEKLENSFSISYTEDGDLSYNVSGTALKRFLADVYGHSSTSDLGYNDTLGYDESQATPEQVLSYLARAAKYGVSDSYDTYTRYEIIVLRQAIDQNYYSRYRTTTIASGVSDATIAYINEHSDTLTGVSIEENTIRKYNDSVYFASIIGYTGKISAEEYETYSAIDASYTTNDTVGKSGLEQYYESYLRGVNGEKVVYINNMGRITEEISETAPTAGNNLYLTIDADLQAAAYQLLEQEIAGIVYTNIKNKNIPIEDVYFALINNNIIDLSEFSAEDATETEHALYNSFAVRQESALNLIGNSLENGLQILNDMSDEMLDYFTYIMSMLRSDGVLRSSSINSNDDTYLEWKAGNISPREYLTYCISQEWIDSTGLDVEDKYADTSEIYTALVKYITSTLVDDKDFAKLVYKYMINDGSVTGRQLCLVLLDQGAVAIDETRESDVYNQLYNGTLSPYTFLMDKINNLEITPAQLALDPCTGSCVITDAKTGELKALVSYPGYDNNKLANGVDAAYYRSLLEDQSNPQWNYATQERTAPGSTFKMVTSTAVLAEDVIETDTQVTCTGKFLDVDNEPECWIYPGTHGSINVSEALRDSCNVFFYTMGYKLAQNKTGNYNDNTGIDYLTEYASIYGLNEKTGLEIAENTPEIATQYPVMAAIGQSNNNFTTVSLARYVTAVATGKLYQYQLMSRIVSYDGVELESRSTESVDITPALETNEWSAIHSGMRLVVQNLDSFDGFDIPTAGKTGTAQQVETRPNHALFVGYAPYEDPEITIAVRIAYGYSSHNAASAARNILSYYFEEQSLEDILSMKASGVNSSSSNTVTD